MLKNDVPLADHCGLERDGYHQILAEIYVKNEKGVNAKHIEIHFYIIESGCEI